MSVRIQTHPSFRELNRLADRELTEERRLEIHEHLGACQRCRDEVSLMRDLGRAAREISYPSPPEDTLSRILERRAAGDRVILPVASALRSSSKRKAVGIAAGLGGALLAATLLLLPADKASAGASNLRFDPAQPEPGDRIEVTYTPTSALAAEEVLYLRGSFRRSGDPQPRLGVPGATRIELHPDPDGTFSGSLHVPVDAAFGYFAVENRGASEIDVKDGRFWPLLTYRDGTPTREALREQLQVVEPEDVEIGLTATVMLLEHYSDDVVGWSRKLSYKLKTAVGSQRDEVLAEHRARLGSMNESDRRSGSVEELEGLWRYAVQVGDSLLMARFERELMQTDHPLAARLRMQSELEGKAAPHQLEVYEREWMRVGLADDYIVGQAFRTAVRGNDAEAVLRWARRHSRIRPDEVSPIAEAALEFPILRELAKDRVRTRIRKMQDGSQDRRDLAQTTDDLLAADRERIDRLLGLLGRLLFQEGRYAAAIDTLETAASEAWDPDVFRSLAESYAADGDTVQAYELYAFVVASESDLEVRHDIVTSIRRRFAAAFTDEDEWNNLVAQAQAHIAARIVQEAGRPITPAGNPRVWNRNEESLELTSLFDGDVAIVVFWTGSPRAESVGLEDGEVVKELLARGIDLITITENDRSPDLDDELDAAGFDLQVYYDHEYEAARSLRSNGLPYFYVVDQQGHFRYAEDMDHAIRLAESLQRTVAPTA